MSKAPWDDCKVAFSIDDADPFDVERPEPLPRGWKLDEVDGTGARWVAVFHVSGIPTAAEGAAVKRWLRKVGAFR